jgi:ferredoxin
MRLAVDGKQCMGHGRCYTLLPELLDCDDEGYVSIRDQSIEVPPDLLDLAEDAEGTCPEGAISLVPD